MIAIEDSSTTKKTWRPDLYIIGAILPIMGAGLITMKSFIGNGNFFSRQLMWIVIAFIAFFIASQIDFRFLKRTPVIVGLYSLSVLSLMSLFIFGSITNGAKSWINIGLFSIQPSDPAKLILILLLAKYFSRRHIEIANIRHIIVSGIYAGIIFMIVAILPDFGSAITIFSIWFGMVLFSGISKKHLALVFIIGALVFGAAWQFAFKDYQKKRILNFITPSADVRGSGYNARQAMITVGSGQVFGRGIGYGTQSRLQFLPEYQTDFVFAAFAEEWGFIGVIILLGLFGIIIARILFIATKGETNFEILFGIGLALFFMSHLIINIGMNIGLMPVTGIPVPFMSYGGSHLVTEMVGLGLLMSMRKYSRATHKDRINNEFLGY
ncbi:MAG: rod shape-determining protein RodA [bacterium]